MGGKVSKKSSSSSSYETIINHHHQEEQEEESSSLSNNNSKLKLKKRRGVYAISAATNEDEFYDGIPRYKRSNSHRKSTSRRVSEVSSLLGRASSVGLERAVEVLDTLGSSMTNLNNNSGFVSGVTTKGNELSILAFEVANTIVKGSSLMQSISRRNIRQLKEVVLPSEGVQQLISTDMDELLHIVAADKREELKVFSGEVVRFGNRCKDTQWHNLDRFLEKQRREHSHQKPARQEAESVMQHLMILVQHTAELYQELPILNRFEIDYQYKRQEESKSNNSGKGNSLTALATELKSQRKLIRHLKKKSLWSRSLEEVMEKLLDVALFLNSEINDAFGNAVSDTSEKQSFSDRQRLGHAGLALHYGNIILQIDAIVGRSSAILTNTRDTLYQSLPPNIKSSLRSKLYSFQVTEELTIAEIKAEMEKTLEWLVPIATNTAKAHHGFGWVGEWANAGSELNRKSVASTEVIRIETLHHADKKKMEEYILELVLWLHHLVSQSKKVNAKGSNVMSSIKSPVRSSGKENDEPKDPANALPTLSIEDQELQNKKQTLVISKSENYDRLENKTKNLDKLSKSSSYSPSRGNNKLEHLILDSSGIPVADFTLGEEKLLDASDRVESSHKQVMCT